MTDVPPPPPPPGASGGSPAMPPSAPPPPPPGPSGSRSGVAPPPPPPISSPATLTPARTGGGGGGAKKGLIIGIVAAIVVALGVGLVLAARGDDDDGTISGPDDSTELSTGSSVDVDDSVAAPGEVPEATEEPDGLGDDPALDEFAEGCYDGDMEACDDLYSEAEIGSDYETYGDTCAGRQEPESGRLCVNAFPD